MATRFKLGEIPVDVVLKDIKNIHLSLSLAISCRVTSHINQDVERGRADFCGIDPLPRPLQIALGP